MSDPRNGETSMLHHIEGVGGYPVTYETRAEAASEMSDQMAGTKRVLCSQRVFEDRLVSEHVYWDGEHTYSFTLTTALDPCIK